MLKHGEQRREVKMLRCWLIFFAIGYTSANGGCSVPMLVYRRVLETRQEKDVNCSKLLRCWCWDFLEALRNQKLAKTFAGSHNRGFSKELSILENSWSPADHQKLWSTTRAPLGTPFVHIFLEVLICQKWNTPLRTTKTYCKKRGQRAAPGSPEHSSSRILRCRPLQAPGSMCDDVPDFPPRVSPSFPPTHSRGIMSFFFWLGGRRVTG